MVKEGFWREYFIEIQKKFNWELLRARDMMHFSAEGIGVSAITVYISDGVEKEKVVSHIRDISLDIKFEFMSENHIETLLEHFCRKDGWEDIFLINLDLFEFSVRRFTQNTGKQTLKNESIYGSYSSSKVTWQNKENLINNIKNIKLRAFLAHEVPQSKRENMWANFVLNPSLVTDSPITLDTLRSYITVQLLSMINENKNKYLDLGYKGKALIVLSGNILDNKNLKRLFISVLDGLEARGEVSILVDTNRKFLSFGQKYIKGIENDEFVIGKGDIYSDMYKVYVCEGIKGSKKTVISTGIVENRVSDRKDVYALYPEFTYIPLDYQEGKISCKLVKGAYFGNKEKAFEIKNVPMEIKYKGIVIDGRPKPVIYGPDVLKNKSKMSEWLDENN